MSNVKCKCEEEDRQKLVDSLRFHIFFEDSITEHQRNMILRDLRRKAYRNIQYQIEFMGSYPKAMCSKCKRRYDVNGNVKECD